jgi:hypothetical protein
MRHVLIFVSAEWTLTGVSLLHLVKVVVEPTVACNDVDCGSIVSSVCYESGVEVTDDFGLFVAKNHLGCFGPLRFHSFD